MSQDEIPSTQRLYDVLRVADVDMHHEREEFITSLTIDGMTRLADLHQLTPVQLFSHFQNLYFMVPPTVLELDEDAMAERSRERGVSLEFIRSAAWLEGLLNHAPTTPAFDWYLMKEFSKAFRLGISVEGESIDIVTRLIRSPGAFQGGFFNPELVQEYERQYYSLALDKYLLIGRFYYEIHDPDEQIVARARRLAAREFDEHDVSAVINKMQEILQEGGLSVDMEKILLKMRGDMNSHKEELFGPEWISWVYSVYTKGWPKIVYTVLPNQMISHDAIIIVTWRKQYLEKYGEEP